MQAVTLMIQTFWNKTIKIETCMTELK